MTTVAQEPMLAEAECERIGGHCYDMDHLLITGHPPFYVRTCKHCGRRQHGRPMPSVLWEDA